MVIIIHRNQKLIPKVSGNVILYILLTCDLQEHEQNCNYEPIACQHLGCPRKVSKIDMEAHLRECGYAMVDCKFCKTKMKRLTLEVTFKFCLVSLVVNIAAIFIIVI